MDQNEAYQLAMREASSAAWDQNWPQAIEAYGRALQIVPNEPQALAGLALALLESRRYQDALAAYQKISSIVPSDPMPHEKLAFIYESLGQEDEAADEYLAAGEIYLARKELARAIPNWEMAVRYNSNLAQAHMRLALAYERDPASHELAVYEYLHVARLLQMMKQVQRAGQALQRAMSLDPINSDIRNALDDLKRNNLIQVPDSGQGVLQVEPHPGEKATSPGYETEEDEFLEAAESEKLERTPVGEAARYAMGVLADIIWTGEVPETAQAPLLEAIDAHQVGDVDMAISAYLDAKSAGLRHPAMRFNLGVLYHYSRRYDEAIEVLSQVSSYDDYSVASYLMLGQSAIAQDNLQDAAEYLLLALKGADVQLNEQAVDENGYERLLSAVKNQSGEQLKELVQALSFWLDDSNWREKIHDALSNYAAQNKVSYVPDLIELVIEGGKPELSLLLQEVDRYLQQNMLHLATEEAHHAIERSPDYLPAHRRLADILLREARTQEAVTKINLVANTYLLRGNADKAADLFAEVIELWPADTSARERVIDMLRNQGRVADALRQYGEMAELYYRLLADPDKAVEIYNQALSYARQANADPVHTVPILKALADIEGQRLNWRKALSNYERATEIDPEDQTVALSIVDLQFQLGDTREAIKALDGFLRRCVQSRDYDRVTSTLEDQIRRRPEIIPLRQRLAEVYRQQGRIQDAITQMDALGELQLDAGRLDEAVATIRRIVDMNPPDVDGYIQLLDQLEHGK
ncbi:MAG: tetratricopeptide repeat protein [Anaerolineae bacterium]|nr:tetratricopeptide repeat protein [Anaerolineae bacterium]